MSLTHPPLVPHISGSELGQHRFRSWFAALLSIETLGTTLSEIRSKYKIFIHEIQMKALYVLQSMTRVRGIDRISGSWTKWLYVIDYNMVCSALFLQRALYTVHCTNIMHSRKPSFVITPAVFT